MKHYRYLFDKQKLIDDYSYFYKNFSDLVYFIAKYSKYIEYPEKVSLTEGRTSVNYTEHWDGKIVLDHPRLHFMRFTYFSKPKGLCSWDVQCCFELFNRESYMIARFSSKVEDTQVYSDIDNTTLKTDLLEVFEILCKYYCELMKNRNEGRIAKEKRGLAKKGFISSFKNK